MSRVSQPGKSQHYHLDEPTITTNSTGTNYVWIKELNPNHSLRFLLSHFKQDLRSIK